MTKVKLRSQSKTVDRAVAVLAQIDLVQVGLQDIGFGVVNFKQQRHDCFVSLSLEATLRVEVKVFDQLLSDGGAALTCATRDIGEQRARCSPKGDPRVGVKITIFGGNQRIDEWGGDIFQFNQHPIFVRIRIDPADLNWLKTHNTG